MRTKWNPDLIKRNVIEIEERAFMQRLEELADVFYDAFCELHKTRSVEPELTDSCDKQDQKKAG